MTFDRGYQRIVLTLSCFILLIGCAKGGLFGEAVTEKPLSLSVIHMNDVHSHLLPAPYDLILDGQQTRVQLGGMAKAAAKIQNLQKENPQYLVLHAGDALSGTLFYTLFKGKADADVMNAIGFDAFTIGNHEFDDGNDRLADFLNRLDVAVVSANVVPEKSDPLYGLFRPYVIQKVAGQKIGIIGLVVVNKTVKSANPGKHISFIDEQRAVQKYVNELTAQGVNKIILLSHYGYENEMALAKSVAGIDVIVGGDSHSLLGDFSTFGLNSAGEYPSKVTSANGEPVCVVQAWEYAYAVGNLNVSFDGNGVVTGCDGETTLLLSDSFKRKNKQKKRVEVTSSDRGNIYQQIAASKMIEIVQDDADVIKSLTQYSEKVDVLRKKEIGQVGEALLHVRVPGQSTNEALLPLGSELAPIVSKSFYNQSLRSDAAILNAGGVRMSIPQGKLTINTAYELLPFNNTLVEVEMRGAEIQALLEGALNNVFHFGSTGAFPYAYGLRYDVNAGAEKGNRVSNIEIKDRKSGKWQLLINDQRYVLVTISYLAGGKDGYATFKTVQNERGKGVDTYLNYTTAFIKFIEKESKEGKPIKKLPPSDYPVKKFIPKQ